MTLKDLWRKYQVEADSVEDFLARYYKVSRYTARGEEYAAALRASNERDLERDGVTIISHHDSKTGEVVAFYGKHS